MAVQLEQPDGSTTEAYLITDAMADDVDGHGGHPFLGARLATFQMTLARQVTRGKPSPEVARSRGKQLFKKRSAVRVLRGSRIAKLQGSITKLKLTDDPVLEANRSSGYQVPRLQGPEVVRSQGSEFVKLNLRDSKIGLLLH